VIADIDPRMITLAFAGTVIANKSSYEVFVDSTLPFRDVHDAVATCSKFWLLMLATASPLQKIGLEAIKSQRA
jgi:hypothetical protein